MNNKIHREVTYYRQITIQIANKIITNLLSLKTKCSFQGF